MEAEPEPVISYGSDPLTNTTPPPLPPPKTDDQGLPEPYRPGDEIDMPHRSRHSSKLWKSKSRSHSRSRSRSPTPKRRSSSKSYRENDDLAKVASETLDILPDLLHRFPHIDAYKAREFRFPHMTPLDPHRSPRFRLSGGGVPRTRVRVVNQDTFDAAMDLPDRVKHEDEKANQPSPDYGKVAVLNLASHLRPGGGWLKGARAQEEALCYRSSLFLSINQKRFYPMRQLNGIYSPDVLIIRSPMRTGHKLYTDKFSDRTPLPVVSAISIAAICRPQLATVTCTCGDKREVFAQESDRKLTKTKMRLALRIAGAEGHRLVVLGALGCGAFRNPPQEIANCWAEVLVEPEFAGGRFREVCFAVQDDQRKGNYQIFRDTLDGLRL